AEREPAGWGVEPLEQPVGEVAVAALSRHAACRCVGVREQAEPFELGELAAHGGGGDVQPDPLDERARAARLPGGDELLDHAAQDRPLAAGELELGHGAHLQGFYASSSAVTPPPRKRPR